MKAYMRRGYWAPDLMVPLCFGVIMLSIGLPVLVRGVGDVRNGASGGGCILGLGIVLLVGALLGLLLALKEVRAARARSRSR